MLSWPPPSLDLPPTCSDDPELSKLAVLRQIFDWVYLTLDADVWRRSPYEQSLAVLRAAANVAQCLHLTSRGLLASSYPELMTIAALANLR